MKIKKSHKFSNFDTFSKNNIPSKAKNNSLIRVLYKKQGQAPEVKIINNVFKLKKAIVKRNLDIIPYEKLYIICNSKKSMLGRKSNIILTFNSVYGDMILVNIDKKEREFKGLSQEDIIWYSQDLIKKSAHTNSNSIKKTFQNNFTQIKERDYQGISYSSNFENSLINVLINIELILASLLKNPKK